MVKCLDEIVEGGCGVLVPDPQVRADRADEVEHHPDARIAQAESAFAGADAGGCAVVTNDYALSANLLHAALTVWQLIGRLSDVVHATTIALALPALLEPGEVVTNRPSLCGQQ